MTILDPLNFIVRRSWLTLPAAAAHWADDLESWTITPRSLNPLTPSAGPAGLNVFDVLWFFLLI